MTYGANVLDIKGIAFVQSVSLQLIFTDILAEMDVGLHAQLSLNMSKKE
jgi:hypothetical protein